MVTSGTGTSPTRSTSTPWRGLLGPYGEEAQVVGYLHDVVEDAGVSVERIREGFGDLVAECVALVTDPPGLDRAGRKARTNAKLAKVEGRARLALVVKAADRLANLRASSQRRGQVRSSRCTAASTRRSGTPRGGRGCATSFGTRWSRSCLSRRAARYVS